MFIYKLFQATLCAYVRVGGLFPKERFECYPCLVIEVSEGSTAHLWNTGCYIFDGIKKASTASVPSEA